MPNLRDHAESTRHVELGESSNLRLADPTRQVGPARVHRKHPLERHLTDLVNVPAPSTPMARYSAPLQRPALQQTLTHTPTTPTPPSPYPTSRHLGTLGSVR